MKIRIFIILTFLSFLIKGKAQVEINSTGTGSPYILNVPIIIPIRAGVQVTFKANVVNPTPTSINVTSSGVILIKKEGGTVNLAAGDIKAGQVVTLAYDGTFWQMLSSSGNSPSTGSVTGTGTQNYVTKWNNASGTTIGNSLIFDDGTNVGIGTATPSSQLVLFGGVVDPLQMTVESGGGGFKTGYRIKTATNEWFMGQETAASGQFRISHITTGQVRFEIDGSGNVGIGTTSPGSKLHVAGNNPSSIVNQVAEDVTPNLQSGILMLRSRGSIAAPTAVQNGDYLGGFYLTGYDGTAFGPNGPSAGMSAKAVEMFTSTSTGTELIFHTTSIGSNNSLDRMVINANGNIGIGTPNPAQKLEVEDGHILLSNTGTQSELRFKEAAANGGNIISFKSPPALAANVNYTLPLDAGAMNDVLSTDGTGVLSWQTAAAAGWSLTGNSGTNPVSNFAGTTDNDFLLKGGTGANIRLNHSSNTAIHSASQHTFNTSTGTGPGVLISGGTYTSAMLGIQRNAAIATAGFPIGSLTFSAAGSAVNQAEILAYRDAASTGSTDIPTALTFWTTLDGLSTSAERMRITNSGNIGVGLNAPASRFHSSGQIRSGIPLGGLGGGVATTGSLLLYNASTANTVSITAPVATATYSLTLPVNAGTPNYILSTDGTGITSWVSASAASNAWTLGGNGVASLQNLGTTTAFDLPFITSGVERMRLNSTGTILSSSTDNALSLGSVANSWKDIYADGYLYINGERWSSLSANNTLIGTRGNQSFTTGNYNVGVGALAGNAITTGNRNTFVGNNAGQSLSTSSDNTLIGELSGGLTSTLGDNNTFLGSYSGYGGSNSGYQNTFLGFSAGQVNTTGYGNVYTGAYSGYNNSSGFYNSSLGLNSGQSNTSGASNVYLGYSSGSNVSTGSNNTFLGSSADLSSFTQRNKAVAIGYNAKVDADNSMALGGTGADAVKVGIGTTIPSTQLHVVGGARVTGLVGPGTVIADATGLLSIAAGGTITGSGTTNYLARWTSGTQLGIGATYDNGTNVGIGNAAPGQKLHITDLTNGPKIRLEGPVGSASVVNNTLEFYETSTFKASMGWASQTAQQYWFLYEGGTNSLVSKGANIGIGTISPVNKLDVEGGMAIGATYSGTNTAPTNGLLVEGNVGIGTPTPSYKVHTLLSNGYVALEANTLGATYGMRFISPDRNWYFLLSGGGTAAGSFGLYDGTASAYRMYVDPSTGNTGFGTTTTPERLNIAGRMYGTTGIHIGAANGGQGLVTLQNDATVWSDIFECYTSAATQAFVVKNTGFVGINDASPSYNLDVTSASASYAGRFQNTGTGGADGLNVSVQTTATATGTRYGILSTVTGGLSAQFGVYGQAYSTGTTNYGVYGYAANGTTSNYGGYFSGNVNVTGNLSKGTGTFKIDHPLDPENKILYHSFVESPDMMNVYNGNITTDANGLASVELPDYFEALNKDFRYQLTVMGDFAQVIVLEKVKGNMFKIKTDKPNVEVSWQVTGIRKDPLAELNRVIPEVEKTQEEKGLYLYPKAYGKPEEMGVDYRIIKEQQEKDKLYRSEIEQKKNNSKEVKELKVKDISVPGNVDPTGMKKN